ncbi:MAG: hypothetical protein KAJ18_06165 [Candidatus Omnitrophica bacterium]|nr:hypothetical protein [Candidatus Omnitrophota bacterium]
MGLKYFKRNLFLLLLIFNVTVASAETILRKTHVERGCDLLVDVYYSGGKEIARQARDANGVIEKKGKILNGRVEFTDEYSKTSGEEYYRKGKKHGLSQTFYENGKIKEKALYEFGRLIWREENYQDGTLRLKVDYSDARAKEGNAEAGIGKLYYKNGNMKYEWHCTYTSELGFRKTYNQKGQLMYEEYFNEDGVVVEKKSY